MTSQLDIGFDPTGSTGGGGSGGGPHDDDPKVPRVVARSQGLLTLAFGVALGVALLVFYWLVKRLPLSQELENLVGQLAWWKVFLFGFIGGTLFSAVYNLLVVRRLNLFGLDNNAD